MNTFILFIIIIISGILILSMQHKKERFYSSDLSQQTGKLGFVGYTIKGNIQTSTNLNYINIDSTSIKTNNITNTFQPDDIEYRLGGDVWITFDTPVNFTLKSFNSAKDSHYLFIYDSIPSDLFNYNPDEISLSDFTYQTSPGEVLTGTDNQYSNKMLSNVKALYWHTTNGGCVSDCQGWELIFNNMQMKPSNSAISNVSSSSKSSNDIKNAIMYNIKSPKTLVLNTDRDVIMNYVYTFENNSKIVMNMPLNGYTLFFYVSFEDTLECSSNSIKEYTVISSLPSSAERLVPNWKLIKYDNFLYLIGKNKQEKFNTILNKQSSQDKAAGYYLVGIQGDANSVTIDFNGESKSINMESSINSNIIVLGSSSYDLKDNLCRVFNMNIGGIKKINRKIDKDDFNDKIKLPFCKFKPEGGTTDKCINICSKQPNCDMQYCIKVCDIEYPRNADKDNSRSDLSNIPNAPHIRVIPGNNKLVVDWIRPPPSKNPIMKYIITLKKTYEDDMDLNKNIKIYDIPSNQCKNCRFEINNLKNQIFYDISLKSVDSQNQISENCSNVVTEQPNGPIAMTDLHPSLIETQDTVINTNIKLDEQCDSVLSSDEKTQQSILNDGLFLSYNYNGINYPTEPPYSDIIGKNNKLKEYIDLEGSLDKIYDNTKG